MLGSLIQALVRTKPCTPRWFSGSVVAKQSHAVERLDSTLVVHECPDGDFRIRVFR